MKIAVITSEQIVEFPPIISLINALTRLGHEVFCITPTKDRYLGEHQTVKNYYVREKEANLLARHQKPRLAASLCFRLDNMTKRHLVRKIPVMFSNLLKGTDLVWVAHERTAVFGGKCFVRKLPPYLYSMYELPLRAKKSKAIYGYAARHSKKVAVAEYCRAHIAKAIYFLPYLPYVLPNKSLDHPAQRYLPIADTAIQKRIDEIRASGKRIIMYMGILSKERPLEPLIRALRRQREESPYVLVVLGERTRYLEQLEREYEDEFVYLGCLRPPEHLAVASYADIAYVCYVPQQGSVNAVFCAPNKVYEFAGFGIPLLCNDVPGLRFEVSAGNFGVCVSDLNEVQLLRGITTIEQNYEQMASAAKVYFEKTDVLKTVRQIISENSQT